MKAKNADVISDTRQDFVEFPDVWVSKSDFSDAKKLSAANPQQAQYNWGSAELVNWISGDGQRLQGILVKPENFSYWKKDPMITYFYERVSDTLHAYHAPAPSTCLAHMLEYAMGRAFSGKVSTSMVKAGLGARYGISHCAIWRTPLCFGWIKCKRRCR